MPATHRLQEAWQAKERIAVPLLSDFSKDVSTAYEVAIQHAVLGGTISARAAFVIDETGTIVYAEQTPTTKDLPSFKKIKQVLGATTFDDAVSQMGPQ